MKRALVVLLIGLSSPQAVRGQDGPVVVVLDTDVDRAALDSDVRLETHPKTRSPLLTAEALRAVADHEAMSAASEGARLDARTRARVAGRHAEWEQLSPDHAARKLEALNATREALHGTAMLATIAQGAPGVRLLAAPLSALEGDARTLPIDVAGLRAVYAQRRTNALELAAWLRRRGARIVNVSLGLDLDALTADLAAAHPDRDPGDLKRVATVIHRMEVDLMRTLVDALPEALFVVAAGNGGARDPSNTFPRGLEARPNVLRVAALDGAGKRLDPSSDRGLRTADVAHEGTARGLRIAGVRIDLLQPSTSTAAARTSAVAAQVLLEDPSLTPAALKDLLERATDRPFRLRGSVRAGRLDPARALSLARGEAPLSRSRLSSLFRGLRGLRTRAFSRSSWRAETPTRSAGRVGSLGVLGRLGRRGGRLERAAERGSSRERARRGR